MASGRGSQRSGRRRRWALLLVVTLAALAAGGAALSRMWVRGPKQAAERLDLLYEAWNEFNSQRFDQAIALLDRRGKTLKPTGLDWMLRARIAEARGQWAQAVDHLQHINDSDPISAQAWLKAGQIELERHRALAAETALLRSIAINPDQIQPYRELAYLYAIQRRKAECDAQFVALAHRLPMTYVVAFVWCQNYCDIWDPEKSGKVLLKFVAQDPGDRWSRLALATSQYLMNQFDQTTATLAPLADSDLGARALRVKVAVAKGEIEAAADLLQGAPEDDGPLNELRGQMALHAGDAKKAAAYFRAAIARDPESRHAIHGLGLSLRLLNDPEAERWLQVAARHDSLKRAILDSVTTLHTDKTLYTKLGTLCESLQRREEACAWYHLAVEQDALDLVAQQGLTRLDPDGLARKLPDTRFEFQ